MEIRSLSQNRPRSSLAFASGLTVERMIMRTLITSLILIPVLLSAQLVTPLWSSLIGSGGRDTAEEAVFSEDGRIFMVGNLAQPLPALPGGPAGQNVENPK